MTTPDDSTDPTRTGAARPARNLSTPQARPDGGAVAEVLQVNEGTALVAMFDDSLRVGSLLVHPTPAPDADADADLIARGNEVNTRTMPGNTSAIPEDWLNAPCPKCGNSGLHACTGFKPSTPSARPPKPAECREACPSHQVCDHCQWPPATSDAAPSAQVSGGREVAFERVAWHIGKAVEYIEKVYPDAKRLDRGPILRNMRRWHEQLTAALSAPQARPDGPCDACGDAGYTVRPSGPHTCWKCKPAPTADGGVAVWCKPGELDDALKAVDEDGAHALFVSTVPKGPYTLALRTTPAPDAVARLVEGECHKLDTPTTVRFYEQDFYVLSNFSAFTLQWKGRRFDTSEAAYHWEKFTDAPEVQDMILEAPSAHEAFKLAESQKVFRRPDWDAVKLEIMRDILRAKAAQHEYVRRKLLATGDRELIEDSWRDDYWGWGPNRDGQNWLGKLWMEVRAELRAPFTAAQQEGKP